MTKTTISILTLLLCLTGCGAKPTVQIKTSLPTDTGAGTSAIPQELRATASLSEEDWQNLQALFQSFLPRIEVVENAVLWMPQLTTTVVNQLQAQLEITSKLLEKTECLLKEAEKTRAVLEQLAAAAAAAAGK